MTSICSNSKCEREVFNSCNECVLHCEKKEYSKDFVNKELLVKFYDALIEYIVESEFSNKKVKTSDAVNTKTLKFPCLKYIVKFISKKKTSENFNLVDEEVLKTGLTKTEGSDETVVFKDIFFPGRKSRDFFDYFNIFKKIKGAHFIDCKFTVHLIDIPKLEMFFQGCEFLEHWSLSNSKLLKNESNILFQSCKFKEDVSLDQSGLDDSLKRQFEVSLFSDCKFEKELSFRNVKLKSPVFKNTGCLDISKLTIENCEVDERFILNKLNTKLLTIKNSEFKAKVELKKGSIDKIELTNTNFNGLFDSFNTKYEKFECFKCIYSDFVGFERCQFTKLAKFKYATFLSFTNFRDAVFFKGLDLQDTNLKEAPNFLNIDLQSNNTNRETLRIIKDSFDKIGNHIEANKFFGREMSKYTEELVDKPLSQEKIIFWLNKGISNFGQSYIRPVVWMLLFSVIYYLLVLGYDNNVLYKALPIANNIIGFIADIANSVVSSLIPFKSVLKEGMEFVSLIFYIIFASLIWQTIIAVKRHTRR